MELAGVILFAHYTVGTVKFDQIIDYWKSEKYLRISRRKYTLLIFLTSILQSFYRCIWWIPILWYQFIILNLKINTSDYNM